MSKIGEIYREYYNDVYQFVIFFTGDRVEAEDITQEVFIRVLNALPKFNGQSQMKTWILSIAKYVAIDKYRKKKLISFLKQKEIVDLPSDQKSPHEVVEEEEKKKVIYNALMKLKPKYRMVIILRGLKELSIQETADILNCSDTNVRVNYHRALKMLKNEISSDWKELEVMDNAK